MQRATGSKLTIAIFLISLITWGTLIYYFGSERIVDFIGVENGYWVMFLVALFGGVSSLTGIAYPATILTLASGGLDPLYLALASAAGVSVGDTVYFFLAHHFSHFLHTRDTARKYIDKIRRWLRDKPNSLIAGAIYAYAAFTPLPNDILTIAMGLARQPYFLVISALVLGNFTHTYLIAKFGQIFPF
jgi:membrane protein YqaA with SNARE-associated domain